MPSELEFGITVEYVPKLEGLDKPDVLLKSLAKKVADEAKKRIRNSQDLRGGRMKALAPSTIRRKKKTASSPPMVTRPLWNTGQMFHAISFWKTKKGEWAAGVKPVGSPPRDLLGIIHQQEGASRKRVRRMFIGISSQTARRLRSDVNRWIKNKIKKAGLKKARMVFGKVGISGTLSSSSESLSDWADSVGVKPL